MYDPLEGVEPLTTRLYRHELAARRQWKQINYSITNQANRRSYGDQEERVFAPRNNYQDYNRRQYNGNQTLPYKSNNHIDNYRRNNYRLIGNQQGEPARNNYRPNSYRQNDRQQNNFRRQDFRNQDFRRSDNRDRNRVQFVDKLDKQSHPHESDNDENLIRINSDSEDDGVHTPDSDQSKD